jgi:zona occludens toxin
MINLLIGSSGSGKSYEATVFHILEAVKKGRKVITNLPLNLDAFEALDPMYSALIERRTRAKPIMGDFIPGTEDKAFQLWPESQWIEQPLTTKPFSTVWDYYDEWRHPENGTGALFVVDEAQFAIPSHSCNQAVIDWTALHRHWFNDVYYLTQSLRKLHSHITDNVQMVYRFRKKTAWGQDDKYIRKVLDGVRGEVLNVTERTYESKYFHLYRSHTQADGNGEQSAAADIVPIWRHWSFMGAAICAILFVMLLFSGYLKNPLKPQLKAPTKHQKIYELTQEAIDRAKANEHNQSNTKVINKPSEPEKTTPKEPPQDVNEPLYNKGVHIIAHIKSATKEIYHVAISQNGQKVFNMSSDELKEAGYTFKGITDCLASIQFKNTKRHISCDAPAQTTTLAMKN